MAFVVCATAVAAAPTVARAQGSRSILTFDGSADVFDVGAAGVDLTFAPVVSGTNNTGLFAFLNTLPGGAAGTLQKITVGAGPQPLAGFLTIGGYVFNLERLPSSAFGQSQCYVAPEADQHCTPIQTPGTTESPFALVNYDSGNPDAPFWSTAQFQLIGTVGRAGGTRTTTFTGVISTAFPVSFQEALGGLEDASQPGGPGFPGLPYSAVFEIDDAGLIVSAAPEPSTYALFGAGLAALAGAARARRRRAA